MCMCDPEHILWLWGRILTSLRLHFLSNLFQVSDGLLETTGVHTEATVPISQGLRKNLTVNIYVKEPHM